MLQFPKLQIDKEGLEPCLSCPLSDRPVDDDSANLTTIQMISWSFLILLTTGSFYLFSFWVRWHCGLNHWASVCPASSPCSHQPVPLGRSGESLQPVSHGVKLLLISAQETNEVLSFSAGFQGEDNEGETDGSCGNVTLPDYLVQTVHYFQLWR